MSALPLRDALVFFALARAARREARRSPSRSCARSPARLQFLNNVGLDYLSLDRAADTLSGGEAQRIRLATQIGSGLTGVMYVLDEPSIGLHQRDNARLLATLKRLRDLGNTVIVVEHDEEAILAADHVLDMGPGRRRARRRARRAGHAATRSCANADSLTGQYLAASARDRDAPAARPARRRAHARASAARAATT